MPKLEIHDPQDFMSMEVLRDSADDLHHRLVYIIAMEEEIYEYPKGSSSIIYIGETRTTEAPVANAKNPSWKRPATSMAERVHEFFERSDTEARKFVSWTITCQGVPGLKTWEKLERAFLLDFRSLYGEVPVLNIQGKNLQETNEFEYFSKRKIRRILKELGDHGA